MRGAIGSKDFRQVRCRTLRPGGIVLAVASVLVLTLPPTHAISLTASPPLALKPPFTGAQAIADVSFNQTGPCAAANLSSVNSSIQSGRITSVNTLSVKCPNSAATLVATTGFLGPGFLVASSGNYNVSYSLFIGWRDNLASSGVGSSSVVLSVVGNLYDNTTGSWVLGSNASQGNRTVLLTANCSSTSGGSCLVRSSSLGADRPIPVLSSFQASLVAGDSYLFYVVQIVSFIVHGGLASNGSVVAGSGFVHVGATYFGAGHGNFIVSMKVS